MVPELTHDEQLRFVEKVELPVEEVEDIIRLWDDKGVFRLNILVRKTAGLQQVCNTHKRTGRRI